MDKDMEIPITDLNEGESGIIVSLTGGSAFQRKLRAIGIREGKTVKLLAKQPFDGPFVVEIDRRQTTVGRGMARRIIVRH